MKTVCLTPSVNWYSAGALASDGGRLLVGCARLAVLVAGPAAAAPGGGAPSLQHHGVIEDAHRDRAVAAVVWRRSPAAAAVVSGGEDGLVKLWTCEFTEEESRFQYRCEKQHNSHGVSFPSVQSHEGRFFRGPASGVF